MKRFLSFLLILTLAICVFLGTAVAQGSLSVFFFDVGQADATLFLSEDVSILIDAGDYRSDDVVSHLESAGVTEIDLLVGTHPHADHIGQFPQVLERFPVNEVWMSGDAHTTRTFERALDAILDSAAGYHEPRAGEAHEFGKISIEVLHPLELTGDLHEGSLSFRFLYGDIAFIFTGDAEHPEELEMIGRGHELSAHILQLGHHGSRTSTHELFLDAVNPEVAIYSAGRDNRYGHPHREVIDRILARGIDVYGTDLNGTIFVETDGIGYTVITEYEGITREPPQVYPDGCLPGQININTASPEELQEIAHIGPERALELVSLRPFHSIDDLARITGIGPGRLKDIKEQGLACTGNPDG